MKRKIQDDPRYDAVGSSHLREELFHTYLKAQGAGPASVPHEVTTSQSTPELIQQAISEEDETQWERERKERKERAVKEREEKIHAARSKVDAEIDRSRLAINREEGELEFRCASAIASL